MVHIGFDNDMKHGDKVLKMMLISSMVEKFKSFI